MNEEKKDSENEVINADGLKAALIRSYAAGVHFGYLKEQADTLSGRVVKLINARRVWYWSGAIDQCIHIAFPLRLRSGKYPGDILGRDVVRGLHRTFRKQHTVVIDDTPEFAPVILIESVNGIPNGVERFQRNWIGYIRSVIGAKMLENVFLNIRLGAGHRLNSFTAYTGSGA